MQNLHRVCAAVAIAATLCHLNLTAQTVPQVIVETDMGGDSDDAALVAFVNHLADEGAIELLAVMHNGNNEWGGAAISAINTYYGRPTLPIGTYRTSAEAGRPAYHPWIDPANPQLGRHPLSYLDPTPAGHWVQLLAENFQCQYLRRLEFPDAVDVYAEVLAAADADRVVIVNGGFLGNFSNLFAWFEQDAALAATFVSKVARMTGAVGGVNTCDNSLFPANLARHVLENQHFPTACLTSLGAPVIDIVATQTTPEFATAMALDHPVREAYRFKTEVEHQRRHTPNHWDWHIIDVMTSFSVIAWDQWSAPSGHPWFELGPVGWLDVFHNCAASVNFGPPSAPHLEYRRAGAEVPAGQTVTGISTALRQRFFDEGLYPPPTNPWSPEREHRSVTALFDDGTFGGLDFNGGNGETQPVAGYLLAPVDSNPEYSGANMMFESRRYFDQTLIVNVAAMPAVEAFSPSETSSSTFDFYFWGDGRNDTGWGAAPLVRIIGWPGRGNGNPGVPVYRCTVWEPQSGGYQLIASADLSSPLVGQPFTLRVEVEGSTVDVAVDGASVFANALPLTCSPPSDGGLSQLGMHAICPSGLFALDYVMLRPSAGPQTKIDVSFDKQGVAWFSYIKNGDLVDELAAVDAGIVEHRVDFVFAERPWTGAEVPVQVQWLHDNPDFVDWIEVLAYANLQGAGPDHWVYGLAFPWLVGDEIVLEYAGTREGERIPISVSPY